MRFIDPTGHSCANPQDPDEAWGCWFTEQEMLDSTVFIRMVGYEIVERPDGSKTRRWRKSDRLGTIVGSNVIYTHDHIGILLDGTATLTEIEILDANYKPLVSNIDPKSMIYDTPPGLMGILTFDEHTVNLGPIARVGDHNILQPGSEIGQVIRSRDNDELAEVQWGNYVGPGAENTYVRTSNGLIPENLAAFKTTVDLVTGDSGGGAFYRERWVGSNWAKSDLVGVAISPLDVKQEE